MDNSTANKVTPKVHIPKQGKSAKPSVGSARKDSYFFVQSKYDIGLTSLARKCDKMKRARTVPFNRTFAMQYKGFFGFLPLSKLKAKTEDKSIPPRSPRNS